METSPGKELIIKDNRASTGVKKLDIIMEGGLNKGNTLLYGPSCEEKLIFGMNLATANNAKTMMICLDASPEDIQDKLKANNLNSKSVGLYLDINTGKTGNEKRDGANIIRLGGATDLNEISINIKEFLDKNNEDEGKLDIRVIFYSLSKMLLSTRPESVLKFLKLVTDRVKKYNATAIYFVDETIHDDTILRKLNNTIERKITIKKTGNGSNSTIYIILENPHIEIPLNISLNGKLKVA